jgi:hypothetical protein
MKIPCASIAFFALLNSVFAQLPSGALEPSNQPRGTKAGTDGFSRRVTAPQLERAITGPQLGIEVLLAETDGDIEQPTVEKILEMEKAGKLTRVARVRLAALEEIPTFAKFSEVVPRVVGHQSSGRGVTPIYNETNIGMTVQATLRVIESKEAMMQIYVERSRLGKQKETDTAAAAPGKVETLIAQSTTRTKLGAPVLLGAGPLSAEDTAYGWVIVTVTEQ